jgi:hypothetical protein
MLGKSSGWACVLLLATFCVIPFSGPTNYAVHLVAFFLSFLLGMFASFASSKWWLIPTVAAALVFGLFVVSVAV